MKVLTGIIAALLLVGCAGETTQLRMKESDGTTREIEYPKGTLFGGSSQEQAGALANFCGFAQHVYAGIEQDRGNKGIGR